MGRLWGDLGFMKWAMLFSLIAVVVLTLWSTLRLVGKSASPDLRTKAWVDAVIFWGGFAAVSGILGSLFGVIVTLQRMEAAGAVTTPLLAFGYRVGLTSSSLGVAILVLAALAWFPLQLRWRFLQADAG